MELKKYYLLPYREDFFDIKRPEREITPGSGVIWLDPTQKNRKDSLSVVLSLFLSVLLFISIY